MDWTQLPGALGDVRVELAPRAGSGADEASVLLAVADEPVGEVTIALRDGTIARLDPQLSGSTGTQARGLRALVESLFERLGVSRAELLIDHESASETQLAMRAGLRREGVLRGALLREGRLRDGALFACLAGDPDPRGPGGFTFVLDSVMPLKRVISHVVMTDPRGRVLLCQTTFKKDWELPGGIVEPGESPVLAAQREVAEEIGLELSPGPLLVVDWLPPHLGWGDALELLYDGGEHDEGLPERLDYDTREIRGAAWFTADELREVVSPLNARRLPLLLPAKPSHTLHLEGGVLTA